MSKNKTYRNKKQIKFADTASPGFIFRINPRLLDDAIKNNWINDLAFYYHLKQRFTNGEIYIWGDTHSRLAKIYNTSAKTIYRRFKTLKRQGLIIPAPDRYLLKGNPKHSYRKVISATEILTIKDIKYLLLSQPIEAAYKRQGKNMRIKQACQQVSQGEKNPRTSKRGKAPSNNKRSELFYASLSCRYIAKILNVSISQAHALRSTWRAMGIIDVRNQDAKRVSNVIMPDFAAKMVDVCEGIDYGHRFNYNQHLCEHQPAKVAFILRPYEFTEIDKAEWKRLNKSVGASKLIAKYRTEVEVEKVHRTFFEQHILKAS